MSDQGDRGRTAPALAGAVDVELDTGPLRARIGGGSADLLRILDLFVEDALEALAGLDAALAAGDAAAAAAAAHALKGSAGNVGARRVEALAREVEAAVEALDLGAAARGAGALAAAVDRVREGTSSRR